MSTHRLTNYLRTHRRRAGLSQDEVALLLGVKSGAKVSRYERFARTPTLKTALAFETMYGIPVRELFAGTYQKVEEETVKRAQALAEQLRQAGPNRQSARKLEALDRTISN